MQRNAATQGSFGLRQIRTIVDKRRGAFMLKNASLAQSIACGADRSAMANKVGSDIPPSLLRGLLLEVLLHFLGGRMFRKSQSLREPQDMCIHSNPLQFSIRGIKNDGSCLPTDSRQGNQFFHRVWDLPTVLLDDDPAHFLDEFCFIAIRPARMNVLFQFLTRDAEIILRFLVLFEELFADDIDSHVRALRRENRHDEQIQRSSPLQKSTRWFVELFELPQSLGHGNS